MLKKLHLLLISLFFVFATAQANVELNPDHPDTYTVVKGDTLWDISAKFLKSPWVWPEVWHANPHIENPHLIYPGDLVSLIYLDGKPRIQVDRAHPTVKLSPKGRIIDHNEAIPTIPLKDIEPFLRKLRILNKQQIDDAPYIVHLEEDHLRATNPNLLYVRGLKANYGDQYAIVRPTVIYRDVPIHYPWDTSPYKDRKTESLEWAKTSPDTGRAIMSRFWKSYMDRTYWNEVVILGYEVADIATAKVVRIGDKGITTMKVVSNLMEVQKGDLIVPLNDVQFNAFFQPKAATIKDDNIRIVALNNALFRSGKGQIVAISRGNMNGVNVGDVFDIFRPERQIRDEVMHPKEDLKTYFRPSKAMVTLPEEFLANIMVFKTFEHVSYAIITDGNRPIKLFDLARAP